MKEPGVRLLVISGSMGAGKTTVMAEASDLLKAHGALHAAIDFDGLAIGHYPAGEASSDLSFRNLRAVWRNDLASGVRAVIVAAALETVGEREHLRAAIEPDEMIICRLRASIETMRERVRVREPGILQSQFLQRVETLEASLDAAALEDFTLDNDRRDVTAVAREMLDRAGWTFGVPGVPVPAPVPVRGADERELDQLAKVWYDSWQDAHARIVPPELTRLRTLDSFRDRLRAALPDTRVVGPVGDPVGFAIVKEDELYQLFVAASSRGAGVAAALIDDAEARLAAAGVETAWLACAIGNERAARFYEKRGWRRAGTIVNRLETSNGEFLLEVWRYEKRLV